MVDGQAGKGDKERPCNRKVFGDNWIRAFGIECRTCAGTGKQHDGEKDFYDALCEVCGGLGKVEKNKRKTKEK